MKNKKFRAFDKKENKYIDIIGFYTFDNKIHLWFLDDKGFPDYKEYQIDRIIIEQCSGFKDKDQKEGYENNLYSFPGDGLSDKGPFHLFMDENNGCYTLKSITKNGFELSIQFLYRMTCVGNFHQYKT